ncbi:hypothetical protein CRUP_007749, partial [Coryphaenoides rupestris]
MSSHGVLKHNRTARAPPGCREPEVKHSAHFCWSIAAWQDGWKRYAASSLMPPAHVLLTHRLVPAAPTSALHGSGGDEAAGPRCEHGSVSRGHHSVCIQSMDGMLMFFEQESYSFG